MSVEQKIQALLEESKKLDISEEQTVEEIVAEEAETTEEVVSEETVTDKEELKVDVSEDVAALTNGEELSEEFKTKAATIFEAAVVTRVKAEVAKIEEQFETRLTEQVEQIKEGLVEKVDGYLNYVVEQWIKDNELALERGIKTDIVENFIGGLKSLFEEHYIDMPEEKYDVLGEMETQVEKLETSLNESVAANIALTKELNEMKRKQIIESKCEGLTDTEVEKFKALAEEIAFEDVESFDGKVQTIRENYFGAKATTKVETVVTDTPVETTTISESVAKYVQVLSKVRT